MVAIIFNTTPGHYGLIQRGTYRQVLQAHLHHALEKRQRIILIYDISAKKAIYKSQDYSEHYQQLRAKYSRHLEFICAELTPSLQRRPNTTNESTAAEHPIKDYLAAAENGAPFRAEDGFTAQRAGRNGKEK
jgi:hypothetical protein